MAHAPKSQSEKATLAARRAWCYLVLVVISFLCLFFFYVLVINSTRNHFEIQKGFSLLPGGAFVTNLKNSFIPLIVPSIAAPTVFFFMKQYLDASLPMEIVEAARIDGAGEFYTFNKIVLPIMKPALAVQAIFSFVASWNNYFIPALVLDSADKKTLPILIAQLRSADFLKFDMGKVYMMVAIAILPVIVVYLLLSKFIVRGVALGGVKG